MVGHFLSSDIIASRFWHDLNLKPDVRMLQVLKMKATALVFEPSTKNSTTGADASGKYQLAGRIHKFINALTTHSELLSHPPAECSYANTEAKQVLISWA